MLLTYVIWRGFWRLGSSIASAESGETTVLRANPVWLRGWIVFSICRFRNEIVVSPQFRLALGWRNLTPLTHIYAHAWTTSFLKSNNNELIIDRIRCWANRYVPGTDLRFTTEEKYKRKFNDSLSGSVPEILVLSQFSTAFSTKDYREGKKSRQNDENWKLFPTFRFASVYMVPVP